MKNFITIALFPLILSIGIIPVIPFADAQSYIDRIYRDDSQTECREGLYLVYRIPNADYICTEDTTAQRWEQLGIAKIVNKGKIQKELESIQVKETMMEKTSTELVACTLEYAPVCGMDGITYGNMCMLEAEGVDLLYEGECAEISMDNATKKYHGWTSKGGTMISSQDPGLGHESHQLAILLPPSETIYKGLLSFSASEPIQLVALHGPLTDGEDAGQPIWTPDGETKYALTLVDPESETGSWVFSGNAIAIHTMNEDSFSVSYSVSYLEKETTPIIKSETIQSMQDPGLGHESHQLAIIIQPSEQIHHGVLTYSASEPIQLVALHGPLTDGEDAGQPIWTPDGETKYAMTFVNANSTMGTWAFSGNALAVHTMNEEPFTVSYSLYAD